MYLCGASQSLRRGPLQFYNNPLYYLFGALKTFLYVHVAGSLLGDSRPPPVIPAHAGIQFDVTTNQNTNPATEDSSSQ
jgi:hypothetical protein